MNAVKRLDYSFDVEQLQSDLDVILQVGDINRQDQLCLTYCPHMRHHPNGKLYQGAGSLGRRLVLKGETLESEVVDDPLEESDFTDFIPDLKHLYIYQVYNELKKQFHIGRMRIVRLKPTQCLSWHRDVSQRIHIPIEQNSGSMLVVDDQVHKLSVGNTYLVNTTLMHSAFNGGLEPRYNLLTSTVPTEQEKRDHIERFKK